MTTFIGGGSWVGLGWVGGRGEKDKVKHGHQIKSGSGGINRLDFTWQEGNWAFATCHHMESTKLGKLALGFFLNSTQI